MSAVDIIDGRGYILNVEFGGGKDGVDGKDGRDGVAPDLQIGTVKESEDDQPHVTISDEGDGKLSLNFDLVPGQNGQNGEDGGVFIPSVSQEGVISWIAPEGQNPPQAVSVKGETGATFTPTVSIGGEISWTNDKGLENPDEQNIRGPKGEKGDPFTIYKVYNSKAEMDADYSNPDVPMGAFVCITNSIDQSENATLYVKGTQEYTFVTDLSGATGMQGVPGVSIGRIGLMEEQHSSLYKEYGVWSDQTPEVLLGTFNLPVGEDGQQGSDGVGIRSIVQTTTSPDDGGTNVVTVTLEDDRTSTFNIKNGSKGSTGAQGPAGQDGQDGQDGVGIDHISVEQSTFDGQPNVVTIHLTNETSETFNVYNGNTGATGTAGTLNTTSSTAVSPGPGSESMSNDIRLHKISKTGNYSDLIARPTKLSDFTNDVAYQTSTDVQAAISGKQDKLTAGNNITISSNNTISTTAEQNVQSDWTQSNTSADDYIKNKPVLSTVATSGSYDDLDDLPVIGESVLTIRSVNNEDPETYTTLGTFNANATSNTTINLSKVARTGAYGDLLNIPKDTQGSVYENMADLQRINSWPDDYSIIMRTCILFRFWRGGANNILPCPVLRFGSHLSQNTSDYINYIPLAENKSYIMEVSLSAIALRGDIDDDDHFENVEVYGGDSTNCIFYLYVATGSNGGIDDMDNVKIMGIYGADNLNASLMDNLNAQQHEFSFATYNQASNLPYIKPKVAVYDAMGITMDPANMAGFYKELDNTLTTAGDVNVIVSRDMNGINRLSIGIKLDESTDGIDASARIRVLKCSPIEKDYTESEFVEDRTNLDI